MLFLVVLALPINFEVKSILFTGPRAVLLVCFLPLAFRLISGRAGKILSIDILIVIYLAWALVAMLLSSPEQVVSIGGGYVLDMFGAYLLARNLIRTPEDFQAMCKALFVLLLFTLPFAVYETLTGIALLPQFVARIPGLFSYVDYDDGLFGRRLGLYRSQVIFSHPIHYGVFSSTIFALAFVGLRGQVGTFARYLISASVCVATLTSVSSGALLPLLLQILLILWGWMFRKMEARWIILCALAATFYVVVDLISNRTGIEVFLSYAALERTTAYGRILIFEWGVRNVQNNPIFGLGFNDWVRPSWLASSVDNFWLLVAMRYGLPALLFLASAYVLMIFQVARRTIPMGTAASSFRLGWVLSQVALVMALCTVDVWEAALSYVFFLFGSGACFATCSFDPEAKVAPPEHSHRSKDLSFTRFPDLKTRRHMV